MMLITGVTGRHGGTGGAVAASLLRQGIPVRALVRIEDDRVAWLRALGAGIVVDDLSDRRTLHAALASVETAYSTWPVAAGVVNAAAQFSADILGGGVLRNSFGDVAASWIASEDAAKLAVAALLEPARFGEATVLYPSGAPRACA